MRKWIVPLFLLIFFSLACRVLIPALPVPNPTLTATVIPVFTPAPTFTPQPTNTVLPSEPTATASSTLTPSEMPTTVDAPTEVDAPTNVDETTQEPLTSAEFQIQVHPDGGLYVGDQISVEVIAPQDADLDEDQLYLYSNELKDDPLAVERFAPYGIAGRHQVTLPWVWDTAGLVAGDHVLTVAIQPLGLTWTHTVTLSSTVDLPPPEPGASWAVEESGCCLVYYVTNTAADRDLDALLADADQQAEDAISRLGIEFSEPIVVMLMPRVLGHGGFAGEEVFITYLDRNYSGNNVGMVLHHEMVHILDGRLGGDLRPSMLVEGLAVYLSGGHFKPEPLLARAAVLLPSDSRPDSLGLGWYISLNQLADDFYNSQHEIGYLQAGALIEFMVDTWGWEDFSAFYRDIHPAESSSQAEAIDSALVEHFGLSLAELEADFVAVLQAKPATQANYDDVRLTVAYFDTLRRYQQLLDPSAYFLTAWLPDGSKMREDGIVADFVRHPSAVENVALETILVAVNENLMTGDYLEAEQKLNAADVTLSALDLGMTQPFLISPLARNYFQVVDTLTSQGYIVEGLIFDGELAVADVSDGWANVWQVELALGDAGWQLLGE